MWVFLAENTPIGIKQSPSQSSLSSSADSSLSKKKTGNKKDKNSGNNKKGEKKRRITKDDIGKPENFKYVKIAKPNIQSLNYLVVMDVVSVSFEDYSRRQRVNHWTGIFCYYLSNQFSTTSKSGTTVCFCIFNPTYL